MNEIDHLLKQHMGMSFPSSANHADLDTWICDLAEMQGHVVGLVVNHAVKAKHLSDLKQFAEKLDEIQITHEDKDLHMYCRSYVSVLVDLLQASLYE